MTQSVISLKHEDIEKARQVKAIIDKEFYKPLTVQMLANRVNTNELKLKIAFKPVTNCTLHKYLTKVRIEHAKTLLEQTDLSIEQIATKIGLDKSNLDKQFKKHVMKTPTQWRKNPERGAISLAHKQNKLVLLGMVKLSCGRISKLYRSQINNTILR
jgi:YesN/AraC family two-component response regulator